RDDIVPGVSGLAEQNNCRVVFCRLLGLGCPKQAIAKVATLLVGFPHPHTTSPIGQFKVVKVKCYFFTRIQGSIHILYKLMTSMAVEAYESFLKSYAKK
ncbi:MAG: hypothetical protein HOP02_09590, partial [Methylococcaceae bacterium]|nr:hypothetical protein [Methylococcaceae bacterium]